MKTHCSPRSGQRGAVLVLFVIGMIAFIALAGLALDVSHAYIDKTKLQNALDAAALSGAMSLINSGGVTGTAKNHAEDTFAANVSGTELKDLVPDVDFSSTLNPFTGAGAPQFVRVKLRGANTFAMTTWLAKVIGKDTIDVGASAVAGPVAAEPCNLTPLVVCADPLDTDCEVNGIHNFPGDPDDDMCFGYKVWTDGDPLDEQEECYLKTGTGGAGDTDQQTGVNCGPQAGDGTGTGQESDIGPGNFQLLDLSKLEQIGGEVDCSGGGANFLRCAFCKDIHVCPGVDVPTKPGNTVGPVADGINTNFGDWGGPLSEAECPADDVTDPGLYSDYLDDDGHKGNRRRIKSIAIGDCSTTVNGQGDVPIKTIGCFFLTKKVEHSGGQRVWGQFIGGGCSGTEITLEPSFAQKIILYKDPDSNDS